MSNKNQPFLRFSSLLSDVCKVWCLKLLSSLFHIRLTSADNLLSSWALFSRTCHNLDVCVSKAKLAEQLAYYVCEGGKQKVAAPIVSWPHVFANKNSALEQACGEEVFCSKAPGKATVCAKWPA